MDSFFLFKVILIVVVAGIILARLAKHFEEAKLKKENPEAWVRLKEIENAEKQRKHEKKAMGMKIGWSIGSWIFRHWQ